MTAISRRETPGFPHVLVCTVATHRCAGLELLEASCERVGIGLTIFGLGGSYDSSRFKVRALRAGLEAIGDDYELVLMVDAFDSLFVRGLDSILHQWQRFSVPIVFSAERNCHPPDGPRPEDYPPAPSDYRFLNSGGLLGEVKAVCRTLRTFDVPERWALDDDQGFWARLYITGAAPIALDHRCRIFQCQWISEQDLQLRTKLCWGQGPRRPAGRSRRRAWLPRCQIEMSRSVPLPWHPAWQQPKAQCRRKETDHGPCWHRRASEVQRDLHPNFRGTSEEATADSDHGSGIGTVVP